MSRRRLAVVDPSQQLRGNGPASFEKLARTARQGTSQHRGLVHLCATLTQRTVTTCIPPSAQADLIAGLETTFLWVRSQATDTHAREARASCFQSVAAIEEITHQAVSKARMHLDAGSETPLDHHANHVVQRYAKLAAHFTVSSVCHTLDVIEEPSSALEVLSDVEGARAYQAAGLGSARHPAFRQAAWSQAEWEGARSGDADPRALAVQIFHEYLGGRWRVHADAERLANEELILWALSATNAKT